MSYDLLREFGRRIRWGMIGGGLDSLIGEVHRLSARLDNRFELVAGALSIDPAIAAETAAVCLLDPSRSYTDFREMAERESEREDGVEVATVATPFFARRLGKTVDERLFHLPTVEDGVHTLRVYEAAAQSNQRSGSWVNL